jgi:hypothetical protein
MQTCMHAVPHLHRRVAGSSALYTTLLCTTLLKLEFARYSPLFARYSRGNPATLLCVASSCWGARHRQACSMSTSTPGGKMHEACMHRGGLPSHA